MRSLVKPRRRIQELTRLPGGMYRGKLAEDYDGVGQFVLVALASSSVASAYKARVASGDFGGSRVFPRGTPVAARVYRGNVEVFLGNLPRSGITDFGKPRESLAGWGTSNSGINWGNTANNPDFWNVDGVYGYMRPYGGIPDQQPEIISTYFGLITDMIGPSPQDPFPLTPPGPLEAITILDVYITLWLNSSATLPGFTGWHCDVSGSGAGGSHNEQLYVQFGLDGTLTLINYAGDQVSIAGFGDISMPHRVRLNTDGDTLGRVKVWPAADLEPADWTLTIPFRYSVPNFGWGIKPFSAFTLACTTPYGPGSTMNTELIATNFSIPNVDAQHGPYY